MAFYDVAIIGGGPAGLAAAATLARQLHTAVVFDSKQYRNAKATGMHMVPGHGARIPQTFAASLERDSPNIRLSNFVMLRLTRSRRRLIPSSCLRTLPTRAGNFERLCLRWAPRTSSPTPTAMNHFGASASSTALFARATRTRGLYLPAFSRWLPCPPLPRC